MAAMVYGVVTLIEGEAGEQVRALWRRLAAALGPDAVAAMNTPHTSYHVADDYDLEAVDALFARLAAETAPFEVPAPGAGLVARAGGSTTWINLARTPPLNELHAALWAPASAAARGEVYERYAASRWFPHVTLSRSPRVQETPHLVEAMREGQLPATVQIDNLALILDTGDGHETVIRHALRGPDPRAG